MNKMDKKEKEEFRQNLYKDILAHKERLVQLEEGVKQQKKMIKGLEEKYWDLEWN